MNNFVTLISNAAPKKKKEKELLLKCRQNKNCIKFLKKETKEAFNVSVHLPDCAITI